MALLTAKWKDPIYGMPFILQRGPADEVQGWLLRNYEVEPDEWSPHWQALTQLFETEKASFIHIWVPRFNRRNPRHLATLAHELMHAVTMTFDTIGMPINEAHDEAAAYYMGWLYEECFRRLTR